MCIFTVLVKCCSFAAASFFASIAGVKMTSPRQLTGSVEMICGALKTLPDLVVTVATPDEVETDEMGEESKMSARDSRIIARAREVVPLVRFSAPILCQNARRDQPARPNQRRHSKKGVLSYGATPMVSNILAARSLCSSETSVSSSRRSLAVIFRYLRGI